MGLTLLTILIPNTGVGGSCRSGCKKKGRKFSCKTIGKYMWLFGFSCNYDYLTLRTCVIRSTSKNRESTTDHVHRVYL